MINNNNTKMIGRTKDGDPVWTDDSKRVFLIVPTENAGKVRKILRWWQPQRWKFHRMQKPHLTYEQVEVAAHKSRNILKELRNGPLFVDNGFIKNRAGRVVMTRAMAAVVMQWMEACGFVFTYEEVGGKKKRTRLDIDVEKTRANGVA